MRNSIRLFRLFGIEVGLDYSWFLVFLLVVWSLAGHYLMIYQGWSTGFRLLLAVITAVLFFASVVAHEFGHSLVAIRTGVPVRRITLFIPSTGSGQASAGLPSSPGSHGGRWMSSSWPSPARSSACSWPAASELSGCWGGSWDCSR